ncbi:GGDEF domain-containing protein [Brevibacillus daliensis]|uniref:GGDEF domain-containing protein n=1 Tax=Brevibacillus daliensis TaxID=2892995 RepID=UPI001E2BC7C2|nr:GGDEF domain-containing protein [Brevibacillus daliensis]
MKDYYANRRNYILFQVVMFLFLVLLCLFAAGVEEMTTTNWILLVCTLLISMTGMLGGLLVGLGVGLVVLFIFGSLLIWNVFASVPIPLSVREIVLWMAAFLAAAVTSGQLNRAVTGILAENKEMNGKFDALVAIDEVTGFDNEKRFSFDLEEEFSRSRRTGVPFSLLLVQVKFFEQFRALYGQKEADYLLVTLANIFRSNTRITDRKFRISPDTFAILLNNSVDENAQIVVRKIEKLLQHHTLHNKKKQVTLTISFGLTDYRDDVSDHLELVESAKLELTQYIQ